MTKAGCFSWLGNKKSAPPPVSQVMAEQAKRISQDMVRKAVKDADDDFMLRVQGYDENDPVIQAAKEEKIKRRSQDMENRKKLEEEDFHKRLEGL